MRYSTRLSDAIHIMVYISLYKEGPITSAKIAESIHTNPAYVRMLMAKLKAAGLIKSQRGSAKTQVARPTDEITLFDLYRAIEGERPLLHLDTHVSPECEAGVFIQLSIQDCYDDIQRVVETHMEAITLAHIIDIFRSKVKSETKRWGSIDDAVAHAISKLNDKRC